MDRKKLRELAEKALPGPWEVGEWGDGSNTPGCSNVHAPDSEIVIVKDIPHWDASFIASLNPTTVLSLLDTIERYEGALENVARAAEQDVRTRNVKAAELYYWSTIDLMGKAAREALNQKEGV